MNQTYKATLLPYALLPTRPSWGDLEGWSRETMFEKYTYKGIDVHQNINPQQNKVYQEMQDSNKK